MAQKKENDMEIDILDKNDSIITVRLDEKNRLKRETVEKYGATSIQIYHESFSGFYE